METQVEDKEYWPLEMWDKMILRPFKLSCELNESDSLKVTRKDFNYMHPHLQLSAKAE